MSDTVDLADLISDSANPRLHTPRNKQVVSGSLKRFGAARSIVVDGKGIVRAGNATLEAAQAAGITRARVIDAEGTELIVVRRSDWSDTEATAYAIADNRGSELAAWDMPVLSQQIAAVLAEPGVDLDAMGFTQSEIDKLFGNGLGGEEVADPSAEWQGMPAFEHEDLTAFRTINVHFKSQEDVDVFAELIGQKIGENVKSIWHPEAEIIRYGDVAVE